jgi:hypothetical protein
MRSSVSHHPKEKLRLMEGSSQALACRNPDTTMLREQGAPALSVS